MHPQKDYMQTNQWFLFIERLLQTTIICLQSSVNIMFVTIKKRQIKGIFEKNSIKMEGTEKYFCKYFKNHVRQTSYIFLYWEPCILDVVIHRYRYICNFFNLCNVLAASLLHINVICLL